MRFSEKPRRAARIAGAMSVSLETSTAMSHVPVTQAAIIDAAIATSVSFSYWRTTGAPQTAQVRPVTALKRPMVTTTPRSSRHST